jgi:hypothetical protein
MNAPQRQIRSDNDAAVAEPPPEADGQSGDAAAVEGMDRDRDEWLCRVGDVARLLREQRRAADSEVHSPAAPAG